MVKNLELDEFIDLPLPSMLQMDGFELKLRVYHDVKLIKSLMQLSKYIEAN